MSKTNFVRHSSKPTVSQGQISHFSWVSEGLRNSQGTHRETLNTKESLKRGFYLFTKEKEKSNRNQNEKEMETETDL